MAAQATLTVSLTETEHFRRLARFVTDIDAICQEREDAELEDALLSLYRDLRDMERAKG